MIPVKKTLLDLQRKVIANMTTESWRETPHIGYIYQPDITNFMEFSKRANAENLFGTKVGFNTLTIRAMAEAIKDAPCLNANFKFNPWLVRGELTEFENVDANVTWTMPNGKMMTVNFKDIGAKSVTEFNSYVLDKQEKINNTNLTEVLMDVSLDNTFKSLAHGHVLKTIGRLFGSLTGEGKIVRLKGKEKADYYSVPETERLTKKDIEQGSVTFSNIGALSRGLRGEVSILSIIPPQVFVACVGTVQKQAIVRTDAEGNDKIEVGLVMPICTIFDHRAVDYGDMLPFIRKLDDIFLNPEQMLNW